MEPIHVLLVDDDPELTELLADYLQAENIQTSTASSADAALKLLQEQQAVDLMVLDIMMPGVSGLEFLQQIRPRWTLPVIMLTGRGGDIDRILGLEMGADDYLAKPCNPRELLARIRAVLRRARLATQPVAAVLHYAGISLDPSRREVKVGAQALELTSAEFNVFHQLLQHPGEVLSKSYLTEVVLHRPLTAYDRAIDVHISRLRQKLAPYLKQTDAIKTVRGEGYLLAREV